MHPRLSLLIIPLLLSSAAFAAIIHVPDDFEDIYLAIRHQATQDGDTILVDPGVYDSINFAGKDVTVASLYLVTGDEEYIANTILDAGGDYRVVLFRNRETANAKLVGLTIRNGIDQWGGGIYMSSASPTLSHLIIQGNVATSNGGGIYARRGSHPTIDHVTITGNQGDQFGAVNCVDSSTVVIANSIIYGNSPAASPNGLDASFCDVEGGRNGEGNIDEDPQFVDPDGRDFHLNSNSGCIDAGDPDADPDPDGTRADMGAIAYTHAPVIGVEPLAIDFGTINLSDHADGVVTITNSGTIPLNVESIAVIDQVAPFTVIQGGDAAQLDPEEEITVTVRFEPEEAGDYVDTLRIVSNDPENGELFVRLIGSGRTPAPEIEVEPLRIDYGEVRLRQRAERIVTIRNNGDEVLDIEDAAILQAPSPFRVEFAGGFALQPGDQADLSVVYRPVELGEHSAALRIVSNDDDESAIDVSLSGTALLPQQRYQFVGNTGVNHSFLITSIIVEGDPLVFGSEVAIFNENDLCCGSDYWLDDRLGLAAWGDNEMTEAIDGWQEGEAYYFKAWDLEADREINPDFEIVQGEDRFTANGVTVVTLDVQEIPAGFQVFISNGWRMISAPVIPEELNMVRLWQPVVDRRHLVMIKDNTGRFYNAIFGFSNMLPWDFRKGYQVRGNAADSLDLGDNYVAEDTVIPVRAGWNILAYFPEVPLAAPVAFADFADRITIAKDASGRFYIPAINFNNMAPLRRGLGYQVRMTEEADFVWNIPERQAAAIEAKELSLEHFAELDPTGVSMSVLLNGDPSLQGCEIAALTSGGRLVGRARLCGVSPWGMAVWGDDISTADRDGALEGEAIRLFVFDGEALAPVEAAWEKSNTFAGDEFSSVRLRAAPQYPAALKLEAPQPNPFNSRTTIAFSLPVEAHVKAAIYDLSGRELSLLAEGRFAAGTHRAAWDAAGRSSGIYIVRLETGGQTLSAKLTLLR